MSRVCVVTGAASGIGKGVAEHLKGLGSYVVGLDKASAVGGQCLLDEVYQVDVTNESELQTLLGQILMRHGKIDLLVVAAGVGQIGETLDTPLSVWTSVFAVNFWGALAAVRAVYPAMVRRGDGHVVIMGSLSGLVTDPISTPYAASKAALTHFGLCLAAEAEAYGVAVTTVVPAYVETPMLGNCLADPALDQQKFFSDLGVAPTALEEAVLEIAAAIDRRSTICFVPAAARSEYLAFANSSGEAGEADQAQLGLLRSLLGARGSK